MTDVCVLLVFPLPLSVSLLSLSPSLPSPVISACLLMWRRNACVNILVSQSVSHNSRPHRLSPDLTI